MSDLPSRFELAPPFVRQFIYQGIAAIQPYLEREGISIDNVSTFVDFEQAELVMGIITPLSNQKAKETFDIELSRPDAQDTFIQGIEESLQGVGSLKVTKIEELKLPSIGNRARGFRFQANFQGLPLQLFGEAVAFRRKDMGALVVVGALNHPVKGITVKDLALRLDKRLISFSNFNLLVALSALNCCSFVGFIQYLREGGMGVNIER